MPRSARSPGSEGGPGPIARTTIQERLGSSFDQDELRRIKRLWVRQTIADHTSDIAGNIAGQLDDLDTQLDGVATNLVANRTALAANATSLADLATETRDLADRLGEDTLTAAIDDARWLLVALLVVGSVGAIVPAAGALAAGLWLRRRLLGGGPSVLT
jgi:hypothetical protein